MLTTILLANYSHIAKSSVSLRGALCFYKLVAKRRRWFTLQTVALFARASIDL